MPTRKKITQVPLLFVVAAAATVVGCSEVESEVLTGHQYMDIHRGVDGLTAEAIAGAHAKDVEVQKQYDVNYKKYWYDKESGTVFCLVDAPSKELAARVHKEAHGLVADEIIEVSEGH